MPIKQGLAFLKLGLSASWSINYETRRKIFLRDRLHLTLQIAVAVVVTFLIQDISQAATNPLFFGWDLVLDGVVGLCLFAGLALLKTRLGERYPELLFLGFSWSALLVPQLGAVWRENVNQILQIWTLTFLIQATLMPVYWLLHVISQLSAPIGYFALSQIFDLGLDDNFVAQPGMPLYLFWFCLICDISVFLYERLQRAEFSARRELEAAYQTLALERERSERLLLNILPKAIAERLKNEKSIIADQFAEATVLFADIVGFTQLSSKISAAELVVLLNCMFSMFDQLTEQHGAEKIKTIGDAYMVAAGLPTHRSDHAQAIANLALDMQKAIAEFNAEQNQSFSIRIGINTGPVVAGVIGLKRFIYDLWGDTVNVASRMESHGLAGGIQVSETTYQCLKEQYLFEKRGIIQVKGRGEMTTYFLIGKQTMQDLSSLSTQ
ncbi:MAG TPA: adenylate/guanylate cyclase domain-containing protein [Coleofasciculaceae cyanobacterium]